MTGYFVFKVLLEDTGDIVRLESVLYTSQSYYYDSTNDYYRERVVLNYDIINNERIDIYVKWINKKYNGKKYSNNFIIN